VPLDRPDEPPQRPASGRRLRNVLYGFALLAAERAAGGDERSERDRARERARKRRAEAGPRRGSGVEAGQAPAQPSQRSFREGSSPFKQVR
jgi:hypothetical protein